MTESGQRPTRKARVAEPPRSYLDGWGHVVTGIVQMDTEAVHEEIMDELRKGRFRKLPTGSEIIQSLDRVSDLYVQAVRLSAKARAEYEVFKEDHAKWLEPLKTAARLSLEEMKKEKEHKKQISEAMVLDQVRGTWSEQYEKRVEDLKNYQAAVHSLEALPDALKMRARALSDMKDVLLATGTASGR